MNQKKYLGVLWLTFSFADVWQAARPQSSPQWGWFITSAFSPLFIV